MVRGSYALAAISVDDPGKIVVARKDSPLVIGLGAGGFFVASDASGILKYTRDVIFMNDGEIGAITDAGIDITTLEGVSVEKKIETIEWDPEAAEKSGYEHFMLKEIHQGYVFRKNIGRRGRSWCGAAERQEDCDHRMWNLVPCRALW